MRNLREWLEEFTESLEETEVLALHTFLMTRSRNGLQEWHPGNNHRYTDNSLEFGKSFEELSWNHRTSTPHLRRIGLQKERYAE